MQVLGFQGSGFGMEGVGVLDLDVAVFLSVRGLP